MKFPPALISLLALCAPAAAERINHEGRLLGPTPIVTAPLLFNTPAADAVVAAMQIMPVTSPWNEDISARPLLTNSAAMIAQITSELAASRRTLRPFFEMNYVLVPDDQPAVSIEFFNYADESDLDGGLSPQGLYPIPTNLPIETWPIGTGGLTLSEWQQDMNGEGGDRHAIIVKPGAATIWETWLTKLTPSGWEASNGAKFSIATNALRPAGWTSGDAAGLPMFPALVRFDECERGMVEHAMRLVVKHTRRGPIYPATHEASVPRTYDPNVPAMGERLRLKANFAIPPAWTKQERAVCLALKKYGALVADNGGFFSISVCPDNRFPSGCFDNLQTIAIGNFEVVQTTGASQGPRSPGTPVADAGGDQWITAGSSAQLNGAVSAPGGATIQWKKYSGPGTVSFSSATAPETSAAFSLPGSYVLMLSAADGVHAVACDAVVVTVTQPVAISHEGSDVMVSFPTRLGCTYVVEHKAELDAGTWATLATRAGTGGTVTVPHVGAGLDGRHFYRIAVSE